MVILAFLSLLFLSCTTYLLYVRLNKAKLQAIKKKHPSNSKNFELYRVLYSTKTLVLSVFFSLTFVTSLFANIYESLNPVSSVWASIVILVFTLLPIGLLLYWLIANRK